MPEGSPTQELLVFPCNGNGLEALDCLGSSWRCVGFVDDTPAKQRDGAYGYQVFTRDAFAAHAGAKVLAVPGGPQSYTARRQVIEALGLPASRLATVIHPGAHVSPLARVGRNVLIRAGAVVTSTAVIGDHVCILPHTVVHHDVVIGDWPLIGANVSIAGSVQIGQNCYIGSGSRIINGIAIGDRALLGLGSNVIRDVPADTRVAGNPARPLARRT
jgi:sugar O-acyltransferase (sialic acid O-acetyltransferase NeuD family)